MGAPCRHHFCEVKTFNFVPGSVAVYDVYTDGGRSLVIGIWTFGEDNVSKCSLRNFGFFSMTINTGLFSSAGAYEGFCLRGAQFWGPPLWPPLKILFLKKY